METKTSSLCDLCHKPILKPEMAGKDGIIRYTLYSSIYRTSITWKGSEPQFENAPLRRTEIAACPDCFDGNTCNIRGAFKLESEGTGGAAPASEEEKKGWN